MEDGLIADIVAAHDEMLRDCTQGEEGALGVLTEDAHNFKTGQSTLLHTAQSERDPRGGRFEEEPKGRLVQRKEAGGLLGEMTLAIKAEPVQQRNPGEVQGGILVREKGELQGSILEGKNVGPAQLGAGKRGIHWRQNNRGRCEPFVGDDGKPVELNKGSWTPDEDELLLKHVAEMGPKNWGEAQVRHGLLRSGKSCRLRYRNHLSPSLNKEPVSPKEKELILQLQSQHGNKWAEIAKAVPGRTDNDIKNIWHTVTKRKRAEFVRAQNKEQVLRKKHQLARAKVSEKKAQQPPTWPQGAMGSLDWGQSLDVQLTQQQALNCSEQSSILSTKPVPFAEHGVQMDSTPPFAYPDLALADGSYPSNWNRFPICTGYPFRALSPVMLTGLPQGAGVPTVPNPLKDPSLNLLPTCCSSALPTVDELPDALSCCHIPKKRVAGLMPGHILAGGPVEERVAGFVSPGERASVEQNRDEARPAESMCSVVQPKSSPSPAKKHRKQLTRSSPPGPRDDAIWSDSLFQTPISVTGPYSPGGFAPWVSPWWNFPESPDRQIGSNGVSTEDVFTSSCSLETLLRDDGLVVTAPPFLYDDDQLPMLESEESR